MSEKKNIVASVLARLRNHSESTGAPFQQVLQQYAIERFLYRISKSKHAQSVVLKGALLLKTIGIPRARPTMDIDMLRKGKADQASLITLVKDCATLDVEADGLIVSSQMRLDTERLALDLLPKAFASAECSYSFRDRRRRKLAMGTLSPKDPRPYSRELPRPFL